MLDQISKFENEYDLIESRQGNRHVFKQIYNFYREKVSKDVVSDICQPRV